KSTLMVDLSHFSLDLNDAFQFQPDVTSNEYLHELSRKKVTGSVEAKGSMEQMDLSRFLVKWGENTQFNMQGQFKNLMDPDSLWMDMDQFHFQTLRTDLAGLIPEDSLGISIPDSIALNSQVHGSLNNLKTQTQLVTSDGDVQLNGHYKNADEIAFDATLNIDNVELGKILENPAISPVAFSLNASGHGNSFNDLTAKLRSDFSKLEFNGNDFSALQLSGNLDNGTGDLMLAYKDQNLDLDHLSTFEGDTTSQDTPVKFDLGGA